MKEEQYAIVYVGDLAWMGKMGPDSFKDFSRGMTFALHDALPIGRQTEQDPETGMIMQVPAFGTIHWCFMEPVKKLYVRSQCLYLVKDQSEESQRNFTKAYEDYLTALQNARLNEHGIEVATEQDLKRLDSTADKLGIARGPDVLAGMAGKKG